MAADRRLAASLVTFAAALWAAGTPAGAQSIENVAIVVNEASAASQRIGSHYARTRNLPDNHVIRIRTVVNDEIDRGMYGSTIEQPIAAVLNREGLQDRILYLVLTKGVPLRITGSGGRTGTVASVDSELTLLYRKMTGRAVALNGHLPNPYFLGGRPIREARQFTRRDHDIFLVTRLDAFTVEEAIALVDRAATPSTDGRIVLDQRASLDDAVGDAWLAEAAARLRDLGHGARVVLEETGRAARNLDDVLGYYSWGSNDPQNRVRQFGMSFVPGALAATFVSTDARTMEPPPDDWVPTGSATDKGTWFRGSAQSLTGDLIRSGVAGAAGNVAEPYLDSAIRPEILFPAYLAGFNLAEAFYLAMPHLGWQTVVFGDPLCAPFRRAVLTREQIEEAVDPDTGMPGLFSERRLAVMRLMMKGAPDRALSRLLLAETRLMRNDPAGTRAALEEAVEIAPDLAHIQLQLALIYERTGEHDRALDRYRHALRVQPDNIIALNNLAYSLAVREDAPDEAHPYARRAVSLQPKNVTLIDTLGWIEHLLGNHKEAVRLFTEAVRLGTKNPEIHLHAAIAFEAAGDRAAADTQLKQALALHPALVDRDEVRALRGRLGNR
jgi:uncharacterized protein (TIGR03790 family)